MQKNSTNVSRQNLRRKIISRQFRTFAVPGIFVTSRQVCRRHLEIQIHYEPRYQVVNPKKKLYSDSITLVYRKRDNVCDLSSPLDDVDSGLVVFGIFRVVESIELPQLLLHFAVLPYSVETHFE